MNQEPYEAVPVSLFSLFGSRFSTPSTVFSFAFSVPVRSRSPAMSSRSGGRASWRRPEVASVSPSMPASDAPIGLRSAERPEISRCSCLRRPEKRASRLSRVPSTVLRLSITDPISSSRSAIVVVSDAVCASRLLTVPPSPCRVLMISVASWLTSSGLSAANNGLNPPSRALRSSAGFVLASGITPPGSRRVPSPAPSVRAT